MNENELTAEIVKLNMILENVEMALDGDEPSDFAMSFPIVRKAWEEGCLVPKQYNEARERMKKRLDKIAAIIERVDNRAMAADGAVLTTMEEITQSEMSEIYELAKLRG